MAMQGVYGGPKGWVNGHTVVYEVPKRDIWAHGGVERPKEEIRVHT